MRRGVILHFHTSNFARVVDRISATLRHACLENQLMVVWNTRRRKDKVLHQKYWQNVTAMETKKRLCETTHYLVHNLFKAMRYRGSQVVLLSVCLSAVVCVRKVSTYPYAWAGWGVQAPLAAQCCYLQTTIKKKKRHLKGSPQLFLQHYTALIRALLLEWKVLKMQHYNAYSTGNSSGKYQC